MARTLLVSDACVLIDVDVGGLLDSVFQLEYRFAVADVLFEEELRTWHPELVDRGLEVLGLDAPSIAYAVKLSGRYRRPSRNDLLALALAREHACPLLTGDSQLRAAGQAEGVEVHGTLWLVGELLEAGIITQGEARNAYAQMLDHGSRLPQNEIERQLRRYRR